MDAQTLGGRWSPATPANSATLKSAPVATKLFNGLQDRSNAEGHGLLDVWMSHGDKVTALPTALP